METNSGLIRLLSRNFGLGERSRDILLKSMDILGGKLGDLGGKLPPLPPDKTLLITRGVEWTSAGSGDNSGLTAKG